MNYRVVGRIRKTLPLGVVGNDGQLIKKSIGTSRPMASSEVEKIALFG